jgi:hypothetical protein
MYQQGLLLQLLRNLATTKIDIPVWADRTIQLLQLLRSPATTKIGDRIILFVGKYGLQLLRLQLLRWRKTYISKNITGFYTGTISPSPT